MAHISLADKYPRLALEAAGWDPTIVSAGSSKNFNWICGRGHEWVARVSSRTAGQGCPYCSGRRVIPGETDLATTHPDLASQAHGWDPAMLKAHSNRKVEWRCDLGHIWSATPNNRSKGTGCGICAGNVLEVGFNDLATVKPGVAAEADGWDPTMILAGSKQRLRWRCSAGHEFEGVVADRVRTRGCAVCSGWKVLSGFNDLATTHPEVAAQALDWDPTLVSAGSSKAVGWSCEIGHTWKARISHRVRGTSCPTCSNKRVVSGFNDLASTHPALAEQADGWDPMTVSAGSGVIAKWRCESGHTWKARIGSRSGEGVGCPICANRIVVIGVNDLATTHPGVASQADGWEPTSITAGSNEKRSWRCKQGHQWKAIVFSRTRSEYGCPSCSGRLLVPGVNDLLTVSPPVAAELLELDPAMVHSGSKQRLAWQCSKGHHWMATVSSRTRKNPAGCPGCSPGGGFDATEQGWLYLLEHDAWGLRQIGITNYPENRLDTHKRRGWIALDLIGSIDGVLTRAWERDILTMLKETGAMVGSAEPAGRFDGYTESWVTTTHRQLPLRELMNEVFERESEAREIAADD